VSPADVESWFKAAGAAVALVLALWAPVTRWRARRRARREADSELREAVLEASRRDTDTVRWLLIQWYGDSGDPGFIVDRGQQLRRAAILLDDVEHARKRLWSALGMPDPEADDAPPLTSEEKRVLVNLRQTMRLQARELSPEKRAAFIAEQQAQELVPVPPERDTK
jgi:hypothetical protein